jgi:hypothetical protein
MVAGIGRRTTCEEKGKEFPISDLGQPISAKKNNALFYFSK